MRLAAGSPSSPTKVTVTASGDLPPQSAFFTDGDVEKLVYCPRGERAPHREQARRCARPWSALGARVTMADVVARPRRAGRAAAHGRGRRQAAHAVPRRGSRRRAAARDRAVLRRRVAGAAVRRGGPVPVDRVAAGGARRDPADRRRGAAAVRAVGAVPGADAREAASGRGAPAPTREGRADEAAVRSTTRRARPGSRIATVAAFATLVDRAAPRRRAGGGDPAALLSLPAESIAVVLILLAIPGRRAALARGGRLRRGRRRRARWSRRSTSGSRRPSTGPSASPRTGPPSSARSGSSSDATGTVNAVLIVVCIVAALDRRRRSPSRARRCAPSGSRRTPGAPGGSPSRRSRRCGSSAPSSGAQLLPGVPFAAADATAALAATSAQTAQSLREQAAFERALAIGSRSAASRPTSCSARSRARTS